MSKYDKDYDPMLTTYDNPLNPFDNFVGWWKQDMLLGHDTCGLLARYADTNDVASDEVNAQIQTEAMEEIVRRYPRIFLMVEKKDYDERGLKIGRMT